VLVAAAKYIAAIRTGNRGFGRAGIVRVKDSSRPVERLLLPGSLGLGATAGSGNTCDERHAGQVGRIDGVNAIFISD
jgi:hypothetical protein